MEQMTIKERYNQLNRLDMKQLVIIQILRDYYQLSELVALIDEILAELPT